MADRRTHAMRKMTQTERIRSYILKSIVIISAVVGTILSALNRTGEFMAGKKVFMYFTIQSNIAIALICMIGIYLLMRDKAVGNAWRIIKFVGTVAITLTGVVFAAVLAPTLGDKAWNVHNTFTHVVVPIAAVADFLVTTAGVGIKRRNVFFVIIPPLLYAIYAGIGYAAGWEFSGGTNYPYFFLNWGSPAGAFGFTKELPYMGSAWWILALFFFLIIVGNCYLSIADRLERNNAKDHVRRPCLLKRSEG